MTKQTEHIVNNGYIFVRSENGNNEFRSWINYHYIKGNKKLLYNDSDDRLIIRENGRCIYETGIFSKRLNEELP